MPPPVSVALLFSNVEPVIDNRAVLGVQAAAAGDVRAGRIGEIPGGRHAGLVAGERRVGDVTRPFAADPGTAALAVGLLPVKVTSVRSVPSPVGDDETAPASRAMLLGECRRQ